MSESQERARGGRGRGALRAAVEHWQVLAALALLVIGAVGLAVTDYVPADETCTAADSNPIPQDLVADLEDASRESGFPVRVLAAQLDAESGWNPDAHSHAGAMGIAQFTQDTWDIWGGDGDPMDEHDAIAAQGWYMKYLRTELAERPHVLVGAASEATRTGAIPAVAEVTVRRRASLAQATAAAPGEELPEGLVEDAPSRRRRRWVLPLFITAFALVLVVGAAWAVLHWVSQQYYVGESEGHVAVYRGVDQSLGPIHLDDLEQRSDVLIADLPDYDQSRVRAGIAASSRTEAEQIVGDLRQEASGAASPSASPAPQGTVSTAPSSSSASPSRTDGERP